MEIQERNNSAGTDKKRARDKLSGLHGGIAQKMRARNFGGESHQAVIFALFAL